MVADGHETLPTAADWPAVTASAGSGACAAVQLVPVKVSNAAGRLMPVAAYPPPPTQSVADEQESATGWKEFDRAPGGLGSVSAVQARGLAAGLAAAATAGHRERRRACRHDGGYREGGPENATDN
jgi:hypothetical protein